MPHTGKELQGKIRGIRKAYLLLSTMPDGIFYQLSLDELKFQANTQAQAKKIRSYFPGCVWKKKWDRSCSWWDYTTEWEGFEVDIYAVREAPTTCKAIYETKVFKTKTPTAWEEKEVEEKVLVGWDCSDGDVVSSNRAESAETEKETQEKATTSVEPD